MKKVFLLMFASLFMMMVGCAGSAEEQLKEGVEIVKEDLPEDMGDGVIMSDCQLLPTEVLMVFEMDEDCLDDSRETIEFMKEYIAGMFVLEQDGDIKELLHLCVETNRGMGYKYICNETGSAATIHFSAEELKDLIKKM